MSTTKKLVLTAVFLALGMVLPMLFGQIPQIGSMLLPMHIPVFLCAFVCGAEYAAPMAAVLPLLRSALFARPNFYPEALSIALEMAVYALVAGLIYRKTGKIHPSLVPAMLIGRVVRCGVQLALLGIAGKPAVLSAVFGGVVVAGLPGIALQLLLIPALMLIIKKKATA